jgi:AcrR family transcriptional regulator
VNETQSEQLIRFGGGTAARTLPMPPKQARGVEKRDRLYRAALARFRTDGVRATRIEDVVNDAGVSWATFFRYFPRKEDVLVEAAARHFREQVVAAARDGLHDRRLRIRTVLERIFSALLTPGELSPPLHTAALQEVLADPPRFAALVDGSDQAPLVTLVQEVLQEGRRRDEVRSDVLAATEALTLSAGAMFPAVQAASAGIDPRPIVADALKVLWGGLEPRP